MTEDEIIKKGFKVMLDARADVQTDNCCLLIQNYGIPVLGISQEAADKLCEIMRSWKGNRS